MQNLFKKFVETKGLEHMSQFKEEEISKHPSDYIEAMIQLRNHYFHFVEEAFEAHPMMRTALDNVNPSLNLHKYIYIYISIRL